MSLNFAVYVNQKPVTIYQHEGKMFIEGRPGSEFSLRIQNQNDYDCEYILSIDGIDPDKNHFAGNTTLGCFINRKSTKHITYEKLCIFKDLNKNYDSYSGVIALKNKDNKEIISYYYDDKKGLEKRGIILNRFRSLPNPFPKN